MSVDLGSQFMKVAIVKVILTLKIYSRILLYNVMYNVALSFIKL